MINLQYVIMDYTIQFLKILVQIIVTIMKQL